MAINVYLNDRDEVLNVHLNESGAKGEKGDKGLKGDTGAKGDKGDTGEASKILNTEHDSEGNTVIKFNDGSSVTVKKGDKGERGATGEQGKQGDKGDIGEPLKVLSTSTDNLGNTVIKFSDNSTVTVKKGDKGDKGEQGIKGEKGESAKIVTETKDESGNTLITFNDGKTITIRKGDKGDVGAKGEQGTKGDTGLKGDKGDSITVESSSLDGNGNTIIKFSDGKSITVKKGDKGEQGIKGEKGEPFKYEDFTKEQIESLKASFNVKEVTSLSGTGDVTTLYVYEGGLYFWNGTEYKKAVDLEPFAKTTDLPTKVSDLTNDSGFKTETEIKNLITENAPKQDLTPYAKKTELPKNLSELTNDKGYKTEAEIRTLIESSSKLKKSVVDKLPTTGKEDLIYLVKDTKGKTGNIYLEYLWINNAFELIGSTQVDLSGYAKTTDLKDYAKKSDIRPEAKFKTMTAVIDQSNSNPLTCITYEDDAKFMEKGSKDWDDFFKSQLVLFKDGKEIRDLKDEELNGLTEADGDVMVKFPRKGLSIKTVGDKVYVSMTDNPGSEDFKYYAHTRGTERREAFYLGTYLGFEKDGKLRSVTGQKPLENVSITDARTKSQANGKGYEACGFYQLIFLQAMYVLKYGNLDSQTAIGQGLTSGGQSAKNTTGATNGKGVDFGTTSSSDQMRFQYIEDFYGNRFWAVDGVATDSSCNIFTATDNFNNSRTGYMDTKTKGLDNGGWLKKVFGTSELGFLGKEFSGSQSTYYSDYSNTRSNYFLFFGGAAGYGAHAGAFDCYLYSGASERAWYLGGRLMFL